MTAPNLDTPAGLGLRRRLLATAVAGALLAAGGAFTGDLLTGSHPALSQPAPPDPSVRHATDLASYVLFALDSIQLKGDDHDDHGVVRGGNVGVNEPGRIGGDARLRMCQGPGDGLAIQMDEGSQVVADTAAIGRACVLWDVIVGYCATDWRNPSPSVANCPGTNPRARSLTYKRWYDGPHHDGVFAPELIRDVPGGPLALQLAAHGFEREPSFSCNERTATVTFGGGRGVANPAPGVYGDVRVDGDVTLRPGTYTFCNLNIDRSAHLDLAPGTVVQVAKNFSMPSGQFGSKASQAARVTVKGTTVSFGRNSGFFGHLWAPNAKVGLGHRTHLHGRLWARSFVSDRGINLNADHVPPGSTTTAPATSTTGAPTTSSPSTSTSISTSTSTSTSTTVSTSTTSTSAPPTTTTTTAPASSTTTSSVPTPTTRGDS